jgi:2-methylcitrate dehydratase PrpD
MAEITKLVADFVTRTTYKDLPGAVVQKIKQTLLDSVGCALGGYVIDRSKIAIELVKEQGGYPQATIIGNGKTSYTLAAFANGELINALDYEGAGPLTPHVGTYAMPACLSMAERAHASGKDLITALAIGYETGGRVGSSVAPCYMQKDSPPYYELSPRFSYTSSIFGAVAGAGKILRFDNNQMTNALGIAGASTP